MFKVRSPLAAPLLIAAVTAGCIAVGSHVFAAQDQEQELTTRADELRARREARLAEVEPAGRNTLAEILATIENDGFDQIVTVQRGHFRFGFGKISPSSGGRPPFSTNGRAWVAHRSRCALPRRFR